jgi:hypothetical protein
MVLGQTDFVLILLGVSTPMFAASTLSPTKALIGGSLILAVSVTILALTIWRFVWMRRRIPFLLRWGRGSWSFPASKYGVAAGSIIGITIGCALLDTQVELLPSSIWGILILACLSVALVVAIYDFRLHRRRREAANLVILKDDANPEPM